MINWPVDIEFTESKYSKWYNALVQKAQERHTLQVYKETHHIIPRSFGGDNDKSNLVELTAREHYIAHALLWKMKFKGIYGSKMAFAFNTFMTRMRTNKAKPNITYKINSRIYESFRIHYSNLLSENMKGALNPFYGKKHSEETRQIIGEKSKLKNFKKGPENPQWGKKRNLSDKQRKQISENSKKMWNDPEFKEKMSRQRREYFKTPAGIAQKKVTGDFHRGKKKDPTAIEKTAAAKRGKTWKELYTAEQIEKMKNGIKNRVLTPEAKEKMRQGLAKGCRKPKSDEWKKKMSQRMTGIKRETVTCIHCGKVCTRGNHNRWHGDNCKIAKKVTT